MEDLDYLSSDENNDFELSICNSLIENMSPNIHNDVVHKTATSYFIEGV